MQKRHPIDGYEDQLARLDVMRWVDFAEFMLKGTSTSLTRTREARLGVTVLARYRSPRYNNLSVKFSDPSGIFRAAIDKDVLTAVDDKLAFGKNVLIEVQGQVLPYDEADIEAKTYDRFWIDVMAVRTFEEAFSN